MNTYEPVIGLEIHVELKTASGMFCGCKNDQSLEKKPNIYTCPVCLGLPGALPVPNKKAIEWTIMLGLALGSKIAEVSKFDRKHYFYPDLAKGYQISQYDMPLCIGGIVTTSYGDIRLRRIHLEEDTGTLKHATIDGKRVSLVDFNRSGTPLVEIVTEPDIKSSEQAKEFLKKLHQIVQYLGISDADMEKGSMRIEPNVSLRVITKQTGDPIGIAASPAPDNDNKELPPYKVEVKNINSFKFAAAAIDYELKRHADLLDKGEIPKQETRGWDENKSATVSQRSKEEAADYRYFPEPDIPPLRFTKDYINTIHASMPKLPDEYKKELIETHKLSEYQADILVEYSRMRLLFEQFVSHPKIISANLTGVTVANWVINKAPDFYQSVDEVVDSFITSTVVEVVSDDRLHDVVIGVLKEQPKAVADYKSGKQQSAMFLMGMVRKQLPKADTTVILDALKIELNKS